MTYEEAAERAAQVAGGLAGMRVSPGDRVVVMAGNRPETILVWLACLQIGAVFAPLNVGFTVSQLTGLLRAIRPVAAIAERNFASSLGQALHSTGRHVPLVRLEDAEP